VNTHARDHALAPLTEKIIGCFYSVYNELGPGFLESVYSRSLQLALEQAGLKVEREVEINVHFRSQLVGVFKADLIVENKVILELKSARAIDSMHESQLLNYLRATNIEIGLLFNFGPKPQFRRLAYSNPRKNLRSSA